MKTGQEGEMEGKEKKQKRRGEERKDDTRRGEERA